MALGRNTEGATPQLARRVLNGLIAALSVEALRHLPLGGTARPGTHGSRRQSQHSRLSGEGPISDSESSILKIVLSDPLASGITRGTRNVAATNEWLRPPSARPTARSVAMR